MSIGVQAEALGGGEVVDTPPAHLEEDEGEDQEDKGVVKGFTRGIGH